MADHGEPCNGTDATFCMHGGRCFKIPSMSTLTCVCDENYRGSRCEQFQLLSMSNISEQTIMTAAVIAFLILILLVLAVIIYLVYKMKRKATKASPDNGEQYRKVESRCLNDDLP